jgi:predicted alpha/beta superfamily hydrolase
MTEFVVRIPPGTPWDRGVFLTGDSERLGHWSADAVPLAPHADGTWRTTLELPRGLRTKYLMTLGNWRNAEAKADGEIFPRELAVFHDAMIEVAVDAWGRSAYEYFPAVESKLLNHPRPVTVWLPPGYTLNPDRHYPVFYLHDGQNIFDPRTAFGGHPWYCDETAERLIRQKKVRPMILVAVGNTPDRIKEYGPSRKRPGVADLSKNYGRFLVEELKPFVDSRYRTLKEPVDTAVGGSSMGGLISLYLARWHPGVFGLCAALSPSLWYNREAFLRTVRARSGWLKDHKIWLDFGTREGMNPAGMQAGLNRTRELAAAFRDLGLKDDRDFKYEEIEGGTHSESAWAARFDRVLLFLFGTG